MTPAQAPLPPNDHWHDVKRDAWYVYDTKPRRSWLTLPLVALLVLAVLVALGYRVVNA